MDVSNTITEIKKFFESKGFLIKDKDEVNGFTYLSGTKSFSNGCTFYVWVRHVGGQINKDTIVLTLDNEKSNSNTTTMEGEYEIGTFEQFLLDYKEFHLHYQKRTIKIVNCLNNLLSIIDAEIEGE